MKDGDWERIQTRIDGVERSLVSRLVNATENLANISTKDCPACKHEVLAKNLTGSKFDNDFLRALDTKIYKCLTCGSKFTCSEECVCKLIKEE